MDNPQIDLGPFPRQAGYDDAMQLDTADPLAHFLERFARSDPDLIYLDGNSLGRLPFASSKRLQTVADVEWGEQLIRSWPNRWWGLAAEIGNKLAPLVGAGADEVVIAESTSVALYKLALGGLLARSGRSKIITDDTNFPTDNYVLAAAAKIAGRSVVTIASSDGVQGPEAGIINALDEDTALLSLSHVTFKSGYLYDMKKLTHAAHAVGALVIWDLSHSVGVVPIDLEGDGVDLAVGCTYKYLNGGPGAPAFLYVSKKRGSEVENPLTGWWGHREPFAFDLDYHPTTAITRFNTGTMPILSLVPIEVGVALTAEAGTEPIRAKSVAMSTFFMEQAKHRLVPLGFELASPVHPDQRGSHVSLRHPRAWQLVQAMIEHGKIIPDFREPDNIRFGFAPLYTTFADVHTAVGRIVAIMERGLESAYPTHRQRVT